jgi:hypothetical protein
VPKNAKEDPIRENRISDEIIVDAYGEEEQAMGWYYYLEEKLQFPFLARCIIRREISPLQVGDEAKVMGMASEDECQHQMFVRIKWKGKTLAVPLYQLEAVQADDSVIEAIQDWHYWVNRGYQF